MAVLGVVPYLNALPLTARLPSTVRQRAAEPALLGRLLRSGAVDAALLPVAEAFAGGVGPYLGEHGIACDGDVESVLAFLPRPGPPFPAQVVLDPASRTSVRLLRVLLERRYGANPSYVTGRVAGPEPAAHPDALTLVIGDRAFERRRTWRGAVLDLGGAWRAWTGLPFVFARWTARAGLSASECETLSRLLDAAAAEGILAAGALAQEHGASHGLSPQEARRYLSTSIRYRIGEREEAGLARFAAESAALAEPVARGGA